MPRDYERSKPLPMHLNITPENSGHYVRKALAMLICLHDADKLITRPCKKCLHIVEPQVMPVAKALTWSIAEARIAVGAAVEVLVRDADFELQQFVKRTTGVASERDLLREPRHSHSPSSPDSGSGGDDADGSVPAFHGVPADQGQDAG